MQVYRVCHRGEATRQEIGQPYRFCENGRLVQSTQAGFHATRVPEFWRRILNRQFADMGLGQRYDHTLLLEIPDDTPDVGQMAGWEYRLEDPALAMVLAIAGPEWPVPVWVPQPKEAYQWEPRSTKTDLNALKWTPKVTTA